MMRIGILPSWIRWRKAGVKFSVKRVPFQMIADSLDPAVDSCVEVREVRCSVIATSLSWVLGKRFVGRSFHCSTRVQ